MEENKKSFKSYLGNVKVGDTKLDLHDAVWLISQKVYELMHKHEENKTGEHAFYGGKITGSFIDWLLKQGVVIKRTI